MKKVRGQLNLFDMVFFSKGSEQRATIFEQFFTLFREANPKRRLVASFFDIYQLRFIFESHPNTQLPGASRIDESQGRMNNDLICVASS